MSKEMLEKYEELFKKWQVDTPLRQAMFLAQCNHESGGFKHKVENLNYSAEGLCKVFGKYFKNVLEAQKVARQPEKIANIVYANRMGNGDSKSGDGWRYRGRGYIQLTGKTNYSIFAHHLNKDLDDEFLKYVESDEGALESALWYWHCNNLNKLADKGDIKECTRKINGGLNGLEDRETKYKAYKALLGV